MSGWLRLLAAALLLVPACGTKRALAQQTDAAQQEAIRKLETRMDELKTQMADIQSQLDVIRGTKLPPTGSIQSAPLPPPPLLHLTAEQELDAA